MTVKVNRMIDALPDFRKIMRAQTIEFAEVFVKDLEKSAETVLGKTRGDPHPLATNKLVSAEARSADIEFNDTLSSVGFNIRIFMADADTGEPHRIWHLLNGGTRTHIQKKTAYIRPDRNFKRRTRPGNLNTSPFPGGNNSGFVIPRGSRVKGIKARRWYITGEKQILSGLKASPYAKLFRVRRKAIVNSE